MGEDTNRGRRMWPQAMEIRRPPGPACGEALQTQPKETGENGSLENSTGGWGLGFPSDILLPSHPSIRCSITAYPARRLPGRGMRHLWEFAGPPMRRSGLEIRHLWESDSPFRTSLEHSPGASGASMRLREPSPKNPSTLPDGNFSLGSAAVGAALSSVQLLRPGLWLEP